MTIQQILNLAPALRALNEQSKNLSAKAKWNLAVNLKRASEVAADFEKQRLEIFAATAPAGANEIKPTDSGWGEYIKKCDELLAVETDVKILRFQFDEIVRDDLQITSDLIAQLAPLLDGVPET